MFNFGKPGTSPENEDAFDPEVPAPPGESSGPPITEPPVGLGLQTPEVAPLRGALVGRTIGLPIDAVWLQRNTLPAKARRPSRLN